MDTTLAKIKDTLKNTIMFTEWQKKLFEGEKNDSGLSEGPDNLPNREFK